MRVKGGRETSISRTASLWRYINNTTQSLLMPYMKQCISLHVVHISLITHNTPVLQQPTRTHAHDMDIHYTVFHVHVSCTVSTMHILNTWQVCFNDIQKKVQLLLFFLTWRQNEIEHLRQKLYTVYK